MVVGMGVACGAETSPDPAGEGTAPTAELTEDMVLVPAGAYWFGCRDGPKRKCRSKRGFESDVDAFWIDRTEVTVSAYRRCVDAGGCKAPDLERLPVPIAAEACNWGRSDRESHPINCVTGTEAVRYCHWLGKRLPSVAEWEKGARGTEGAPYPWGHAGFGQDGRLRANIADLSAVRAGLEHGADDYDDGYPQTAPVGSYPDGAAPHGALDMTGNVAELTRSGGPKNREYRGASWWSPASLTEVWRTSGRARRHQRSGLVGFRCALSAEG